MKNLSITFLLATVTFLMFSRSAFAQEAKQGSIMRDLETSLLKNDLWLGSVYKRKCPKGYSIDMAAVKFPKEMHGCRAFEKSNSISLLVFDTKGKNTIQKVNFDTTTQKHKCDASLGSALTNDSSLKPKPNNMNPGVFNFFFQVNGVEGMFSCTQDADSVLGTFWLK